MSVRRVLIVDDSRSIRATVSDYLKGKGYDVLEAQDGIEGLERSLSLKPDVILLDVVMPGIDGFKLCRLLRDRGIESPIIMLTERGQLEDKAEGFASGADDYLAKPFEPLELELRIQARLKRYEPALPPDGPPPKIKRGRLEIDLRAHTVVVDGVNVSLTPLEFNILKLLASSPGQVYSRQDLLSALWDTSYEGYKRNVDPHINRLRSKLEQNPKKPKYVLTVWGVGYKFNESLY
jgi:DNA-binding response OmpR family regulator